MSTQDIIETKLHDQFAPQYMEVINESHMHNVPPGSESHFKVTLVCDQFQDEKLINRHRAVTKALGEVMSAIHALALHTLTPEEWAAKGGTAPESPLCMGGSKAK
jgi:BolA protein